MSPSILFITGSCLAANPRLRKELKMALDLHWQVTCVSCASGSGGGHLNTSCRQNLSGVNFIEVECSRENPLWWGLSKFVSKTAELLLKRFPKSLWLNAVADSPKVFLLKRALPKQQFDLVVGHTMEALYLAGFHAQHYHEPWGFDVEDFHPCECVAVDSPSGQRRSFLLSRLLPQAGYCTTASPLFEEEIRQLLPEKVTLPPCRFVANTFSQEFFEYCGPTRDCKAQIVWFSQTIGGDRGLEEFLTAAEPFRDQLEVLLIGNRTEPFCAHLEDVFGKFVKIQPPMPEKELFAQLCRCDFGLALESGAADHNRDLCVTNKICAYLQAGLFVLATPTAGQRCFMMQFPESGILLSTNRTCDLQKVLTSLNEIRNHKHKRWSAARQIAWENEGRKISDFWEKI